MPRPRVPPRANGAEGGPSLIDILLNIRRNAATYTLSIGQSDVMNERYHPLPEYAVKQRNIISPYRRSIDLLRDPAHNSKSDALSCYYKLVGVCPGACPHIIVRSYPGQTKYKRCRPAKPILAAFSSNADKRGHAGRGLQRGKDHADSDVWCAARVKTRLTCCEAACQPQIMPAVAVPRKGPSSGRHAATCRRAASA